MTEGLFILIALFVAYVLYVIMNEKKAEGSGNSSAATAPAKPEAVKTETPKPAAEKAPAPVTKAKASVKAATPKPTAAPKAEAKKAAVPAAAAVKQAAPQAPAPVAESDAIKGSGLKDPQTGEVATTYSNYRFTKRWIKEALVAEKLVDKVYKNDELNASVEAKIKAGIIKLEAMKKYKP